MATSSSKYSDSSAVIQVIGTIFNNPDLLDNGKYVFTEDDFCEEFHRALFGTIYNLHQLGAKEITINAIEDYLEQRPKTKAVYEAYKGRDYLETLKDNCPLSTFDYYYNRLKKFTLLRLYTEIGMDLKWMYDPDNILDTKKKQQQEDWLDNASINDIVNLIDNKLNQVRAAIDGTSEDIVSAADGIEDYFESLKETPDIGVPLYGAYMNTVTRGARLGKFYLRSAATNVGKSRSMIADACTIGCYERWSVEEKKWISIGACEPTLFICVEQDLQECQSMMVAFLAGVEESHILDAEYEDGEWERILRALDILKKSKLQYVQLPNFGLQDVENTIKRAISTNNTRYFFFDYLSTSMKILEEITRRSGGVKLREDQILYLMATKLKEICTQYDVFILSSTQLNQDYRESETPDQNLLRGSKAIADKLDWGAIMLDVTEKDREALKPLCSQLGVEMPNIKISVYKNRRGGYRSIYLWCVADKGICQYNPKFVTDWTYKLQDIPDIKIKVREQSAFEEDVKYEF